MILSHRLRGPQARKPVLALGAVLALTLSACRDDGGGSGGGGPGSAEGLLRQAEDLARRGAEVEAARLIGSRLEGLPGEARGRARLAMARLYLGVDLPEPALQNAEEAERLGQAGAECLYLRGESLRRLQRLREAEEVLERLVRESPEHRKGCLSLASLRARAADPSAALPLFERYFRGASPDEPGYDEALLEEGRALRFAGRHGEAAERFVILLEREPLNGVLYSELAGALYRQRLRPQARFVEEVWRLVSQGAFEEHVEKGLERSGASALALGQRAANRERERRYGEAFDCYRRARELGAASPLLPLHHGDLCLKFRRPGEALSLAREGLERNLQPSSGLRLLEARALLEGGDPRGARRAAEAALVLLRSEGEGGGPPRGQAAAFPLHLTRARAALEAGDPAGAQEAAQEALREGPSSWEPLGWLGRALLAQGRAAEARGPLEEALRRAGQGHADLQLWSAAARAHAGAAEEGGPGPEDLVRSTLPAAEALEAFLDVCPPGERGRWDELLARVRTLREEARRLERALGERPLETCGAEYLALGKIHLQRRDPGAFELLFLARDLLPGDPEPLRLLLGGLRAPRDVFLRLHLLRRLLALEPEDGEALAEVAETYLRFSVRAGEALRLASGLHARAPSARSHLLLGRALLASGRRDEGLAELSRGAAAFPSDPALKKALEEAAATPSPPGDGPGAAPSR